MWRSPAAFQEFLNQCGLVGKLYEALENDDMSESVFFAIDVLCKTKNMPPLMRGTKTSRESTHYRKQGNLFYKDGKYQNALKYYNKALAFAPKDSEEMVLAYSNRSALLSTCKMVDPCLEDIETCFTLGCPARLTTKLTKRREEANKQLWMERMATRIRYNEFANQYLKIIGRRNPQISCASTAIGVKVESNIPKVVAIKDVKVGEVLAIEKAFVTQLDSEFRYLACYYCNKLNLNLIPCESCCSVMFCDKDCRLRCMEEYHDVECEIIELFDELDCIPVSSAIVKAAIKVSKKFSSWTEFVEATQTTGLKRMKASEINAIFDGENKYSLLNFRDDAPFKYGRIYNATFGVAMLLYHLGNVRTSFLPTNRTEHLAAIRALSRLMMYFSVNLPQTHISSVVTVMAQGRTEISKCANVGLFPFTGKLKCACNPNVLVVGLNDKVALIALQPLKPGMELTIAPLGHWLDVNLTREVRWKHMFSLYRTACTCAICNDDWKILRDNAKPTEAHLRILRKIDVQTATANYNPTEIESLYPKCCKMLAFLSDLTFSNEYTDVYRLFRKCLIDIQDQHSSNVMLDYYDDNC